MLQQFLAKFGDDYTRVNSLLNFTSGSSNNATKCQDIIISDDITIENNQTFTVTLSTTDPDVLLGEYILTISIIDNDGQLSHVASCYCFCHNDRSDSLCTHYGIC